MLSVASPCEPARVVDSASPERAPVEVSAHAPDHRWDTYVQGHAEGTLFHTLGWRDAVAGAFAHEAIYLSAMRSDRLVGVLPMFFVASRVAGRMLVSVPYGVGGGILSDDDETAQALFLAAKRIATQRRCRVIDFRSERAVIGELPVVDRYVGFRGELPVRSDNVLASLPRKARAAARNARNKYRLTVSFGDDQLAEVWRLYTLSMKRLASLNYPYSFFQRLIEHTSDRHWVSLVKFRGRAVAGLVTFLFKDRVMPYFFGATAEAARCSAANYVYLTVMERGAAEGYRVFDFGRTRRDNVGGCDFKRFQGFEPRPLEYQICTLAGHTAPNLSPSNPKLRLARRMWSFLPLAVARPLGALLSKHIPG